MITAESGTRTARRPADSTAEASPNLGRLGPWQLVRCLRVGAMTRVYLARPLEADPTQGDPYVIKVLRKQWWGDPRAIAMQRREAWISGRVTHPNLLPVLSANVSGPPFYLVTPRLEGRTLAHWIADRARTPLPLVLWIVRQVADGLAALWKRTSMVHADVKPANILVSPTGHATLLDFGFAHSPQEAASWADRPLIGTLNYIAPEAVTSALAGDFRSDMYSLGVTMYELLSGRLPLESDDPGELVRLHREGRARCIREACPGLPKEVASVVHTLLAKEPLRRFPSYQSLIDRLVRLEVSSFSYCSF